MARSCTPALTTVAQPIETLGRQCIKMFLDMLKIKSMRRGEVSDVMVKGKLIVRESSAPPKLLAPAPRPGLRRKDPE